eukprot:CAMPEP_0205906544 /NCGR_PEP_ID=MMETSP1325-20131115/2007_1 /ASSEMBLY_ACC=CAM_ASM_000708 /TAXON_ID=236786 /ORGANISM="Florenciella sp., Strain RCC1007" /LENGTH=176 /DNA_ID=CAMNT_0053272563 /DNA_START=174 /DNA_END=701 /DNA_ORIENTATION=-
MATSLVLAYKFHESVLVGKDIKLEKLLDFIEQEWAITESQVWAAEFGLMVHLSFRLHADPDHVVHHFNRLLKTSTVDKSPLEYLGADMLEHVGVAGAGPSMASDMPRRGLPSDDYDIGRFSSLAAFQGSRRLFNGLSPLDGFGSEASIAFKDFECRRALLRSKRVTSEHNANGERG